MSRLSPVILAAALCGGLLAEPATAQDGFDHVGDPRIQCLDCHNIHDGPLIPEGLELLIACQSCHNPTGMASSKTEIGLHATGSGTIDCGKCHDPHQQTTPNADNIRLTLRYPTASTPVDFPDQDPRRFVAGQLPYDGVCEVCHTVTDYHRRDASGDHLHNLTLDCSSCHPHGAGFAPSCTGCHSQPQGSRRAIVPDGINVNDFGNTSHHVLGNVEDTDCLVCHEMSLHQGGQVRLKDPDLGSQHVYVFQPSLPEELAPFCLNCHDADGALASGGLTPFSDGETVPNVVGLPGSEWANSAHATEPYLQNGGAPLTCFGDGAVTGCHGNGHGSENVKLLAGAGGSSVGDLCVRCHTEGMLSNDALSGPGLADDIQQAFGLGSRHNLGTGFDFEGRSYELECSTCHNPHVVTGKHWEVDQDVSPVTRPDLNADPVTNPRAMGLELWGATTGQKMDDFAARGSGSGGWYRKVAEGVPEGTTGLAADHPAQYQPPKKGSDFDWEFGGDVLPDYTTLCLDCHSETMSPSVYPINWGQGIPTNYSGNPTTWVTARSPHGLNSANQPYYGTDPGWWGNNGNPDPIFNQDWVTRGRGRGHFMRWPYDSAFRNSGINWVLSCTDCHEAHGSTVGGMLRTEPNNGTGSTIWNTMCNNCHYYYGGQHAGMSCAYASCHEQQSIHRIKKNGEYSGGTYLWQSPSEPATTPKFLSIAGAVGSDELIVDFTEDVYATAFLTGALEPEDFLLTDKNGDNPRTILAVYHTPGTAFATLVMSAPLITADLNQDLLAAIDWSIYDVDGEPAGPWPTQIPTGPSSTTFDMNEAAGSTTFQDSTGTIVGTVFDPAESFLGDGSLHGDILDNRLLYDADLNDFIARRKLTVEFRFYADILDLDTGDPLRDSTIQAIFDRRGSYLFRVIRADWAINNPMPPDQAFMWFKYKAVDNHGTANWKQAAIDGPNYPIQRHHWYQVKITFDSDIVGDMPVDIYVDDQGPNGDDIGEAWPGYPNCTQVPQPGDFYASIEGDEISPGTKGEFGIGALPANGNSPFSGLIDWLRWDRVVR